MKYKRHLLIYSINEVEITTTPKKWARANQHLFPNFRFTNNTWDIPITNVIVNFLVDNYNFYLDETEKLKIWRGVSI